MNKIHRTSCVPSKLLPGLVGLIAFLPLQTPGQTFIGNLNGTSNDSTFETGDTQNFPALGWINVSGTARSFDSGGGNGGLIGTDGFANYSVRYDTGVAILANTTYTLSFDMGFIGGPGPGSANYSAQLGTVNGGVFTGLGSPVTGTVNWVANMTVGTYSGSDQQVFLTSGAVSGDNLAVLLAQTGTSSQVDFFAFDNVTLSAVPEPEEYALVATAGLLLWTVLRHRRKAATVAA